MFSINGKLHLLNGEIDVKLFSSEIKKFSYLKKGQLTNYNLKSKVLKYFQ